jgi:hypothetical protein
MAKRTRTTISIDQDLLERSRQYIEGTTYQSVPRLIAHVLELILSGELVIKTTVLTKEDAQ